MNFKVGRVCWRWVGLSEDRWVQRVVWSCRAFLECRRLVEVGLGFLRIGGLSEVGGCLRMLKVGIKSGT